MIGIRIFHEGSGLCAHVTIALRLLRQASGERRVKASRPELFLSGPGVVGLAFTPSRSMVVATTNALFRVSAGIKGFPLTR